MESQTIRRRKALHHIAVSHPLKSRLTKVITVEFVDGYQAVRSSFNCSSRTASVAAACRGTILTRLVCALFDMYDSALFRGRRIDSSQKLGCHNIPMVPRPDPIL